jgi:type I restriction enzyme S subunit
MVEAKTKVQRYERYKDSELEWLGEIPLNWNLQKLKSFLTVHGRIGFRGYTVNDLVDKGDGAVTISPSNMGESEMIWKKVSYLSWKKYYESPEIIVEKGDLLIVKTASIGKIAYVRELKEKATINPQILVLKNIKINKDYFYYQLLSNVIQHQLQTEKIGSTIYTISENKILNFRSLVPPLSEQTAIAEFLDDKTTKIDEAITIKQQQISLLKERKQILIHKAVTQGLKPNVKLKDSGVEWIGEIPVGWDLLPGFMVYKENKTKNDGMIEDVVLSLSYGNIVIKPKEKLVGLVPESFETYQIVKPGDIIIRCMDLQNDKTSLRTGIAENDGIITSAYLNLNIVNNNVSEYVYNFLHSLDTTKVLYKFGTGLRQNLSFGDFKHLQIPIPPKEEQETIVDYIENITQKIETAISLKQQEIAKLKEYKSGLINSVVTGKVKVC